MFVMAGNASEDGPVLPQGRLGGTPGSQLVRPHPGYRGNLGNELVMEDDCIPLPVSSSSFQINRFYF